MIPTPDMQPATSSDAPSSNLATYFDAELDYVIANFPVISFDFRQNLRLITVLTGMAFQKNKNNPRATGAGRTADLLIAHTLTEWPAVTKEKIANFTLWHANAVSSLRLTPAEHRTLLEL